MAEAVPTHLYTVWKGVFSVLSLLLLTLTFVQANDDAKRLYHDLLTENKYNKLIRPVGNNTNKPLTVKMGIRLSQIIDVVCFSFVTLEYM